MRIAARRWSFRTAIVVSLLTAVGVLSVSPAFADASGQPGGITTQARQMHDLYILVLVLAVVVFVAVEAVLLYCLFKYRHRADAPLPPQTHGNNALEVVWTTIPIVIVLVLFVFSFVVLVDVEKDGKAEDLTVDVQGFQFQWEFAYKLNDLGRGGDKKATGEVSVIGTAKAEPVLWIPVNEPVEFKLLSNDVIHSFYVRDFLYKLDVVPGRDNAFTVTARETGLFEGQCAELCGTDHALMRFKLKVVERAEFDAYIAALAAEQQKTTSAPPSR